VKETEMSLSYAEKISEKIQTCISKKETFFSFEFFPPKTPEGYANLFNRFDSMAQYNPLFIDITWSAGGKKCDKTNKTLEITKETQDLCCLNVNMHLTCNTSTRQELIEILNHCKEVGINNILALRGDPPLNMPDWNESNQELKYAVDLVRLIKSEFGDFFSVSVAGYPYGHPDCDDKKKDLIHLKEKVDAGADFVVSQLFFKAEDFTSWVSECREIGIKCPIIPGILPIQGYNSLQNITKMCYVPIPQYIKDQIEPIKDDDSAIKEFGVRYAIEMCKKLISEGAPGLHFYTLNQEVVTSKIVRELCIIDPVRELPWRKAVYSKRKKEEVRPIYWANRNKSYLSRTSDWGEFPNGRWGDSNSPAFGELTDYHIFFHTKINPKVYKKKWGEELTSKNDVSNIFINFLNGKVDSLPWIDFSIAPETNRILKELIDVNGKGYWTINSQPRVNGASSTDTSVGWGGPGGVVYQKAYLEFFTSPENLNKFLEVVNTMSPRFNYQAINRSGEYISNLTSTVAVTWGVFPGKQIIQPTVVDPVSFHAWKDEAFSLWTFKWGGIYEKDSPSRQVIDDITSTYFLVNVVDNDFITGNIFDIFEKL
jgi:methylenetetrahydrofolate reductase (NADPH)